MRADDDCQSDIGNVVPGPEVMLVAALRLIIQQGEYGYFRVAPQYLWNLVKHRRLPASLVKEELPAIVSHTGT